MNNLFTRSGVGIAVLLMLVVPVLVGCSSECHCPRCPQTSVVTPPASSSQPGSSTTVVTPY